MSVTTQPFRHEESTTNKHFCSAEALIAAISEALRQTGYGQLRHLELQCDGDLVTIAGRVPTYFLKQFAQTTVMGVSGVGLVNNEIRVISH